MFKKVLFILMFIISLSVEAQAKVKRTGLGIILGPATGVSGKYLLSKSKAIDWAMGVELSKENSFHIHVDYLWRHRKALKLGGLKLGWFWALGAKLRSADDDKDYRFGPRVAAGVNYRFRDVSFELFGEAAAVLNVVPKSDTDVSGAIGARFFF